MPATIENRLEKRFTSFLWAGKERNPVSRTVVYGPKKKGGRKVLDIKARNKAINVMWLKRYLAFGPDSKQRTFIRAKAIAAAVSRSKSVGDK